MLKQFSAINNRILKAQKTAAYRAINKAAAMTKTQMTRRLKADTGLSSAEITRRIFVRRASTRSTSAFVSFGTKFGVPLSEFKPREKIVKVRRGTKGRKGVTVKLPAGRTLVPKGFMWKAKSGKTLVIARKGQDRYPLALPTFSLRQLAEAHQASLVGYMREEFNRLFEKQLEYELSKKK